MKRAIAFVSMLLMAHLSFVGNDWACAKHGSAMASPAHRAHSAASHQAQKTTSLGSPNDQCEIPARADCCSALASCATTLIPAALTHVDERMLIKADLPAAANMSTPAPLIAPETP